MVDGVELRTTVDRGEGIFAIRSFRFGETVMVGRIDGELDHNQPHASQVGEHRFVVHGGLVPKVNHSCEPNCGIRVNSSGAHDFIARQPIAVGEEITFDYAMRNYVVECFPAECRCGSRRCRGRISGWRGLSAQRKADYHAYVAPYLLDIDNRRATTTSTPGPASYSGPVGDHFAVHRWERDEPAVAVLAIPPATHRDVGRDVRRLAADYQRHLTGRGVSVIPGPWLHVTVCIVGWASVVPASGQNYADFLAVFATRVDQVLPAPAELRGAQVGRTGVLLALREAGVMVSSGAAAAAAAERTLGRRGETPKTPHLGLAYFTSEQADPYAAVTLANQPDQLGEQSASWTVDHLSVVDLVQDRAARQYRWTVRDEIGLPTTPRPAHGAR